MSNDLISREILKNYARKVMSEKNATNFSLLKMFDEIIDNAPEVEVPKDILKAYYLGYSQAMVDFEREERLHGE
jgi:hypothetical protein